MEPTRFRPSATVLGVGLLLAAAAALPRPAAGSASPPGGATPTAPLDGERIFREGPALTGVPCATCHNQGGYGGAGPTATFVQTPSLFGLAALEEVPESVVEGAAAVVRPWARHVAGRVGRTATGALGRFGWRGEVGSLAEAIETGCRSGGVSDAEAAALTTWIRGLPAPREQLDTPGMAHGFGLFNAVGCGDCHVSRLGTLSGAFTDLLLHDMGRSPGAIPAAPRTLLYLPGDPDVHAQARRAGEWRTPPLWGLRDSAPYWHDGSAGTVHAAILAHEGEGAAAAVDYLSLPDADREDLQAFLASLTAP